MLRAALYVAGKIVVGDSHLAAYQKLTQEEKSDPLLISGCFDQNTKEFVGELPQDHFYDKHMFVVRHGKAISPDLPDPDISDEGCTQIAEVASGFVGQNLNGFVGVTSPLLRCLKTAAILQDVLGIQFKIIPTLIESPTYLSEGEVFRLRNRSESFKQFEWPTSTEWHVYHESSADFLNRTKETLRLLPTQTIVVTHFGIICNLMKLSVGEDADEFIDSGFPPASVTYIHQKTVQPNVLSEETNLESIMRTIQH